MSKFYAIGYQSRRQPLGNLARLSLEIITQEAYEKRKTKRLNLREVAMVENPGHRPPLREAPTFPSSFRGDPMSWVFVRRLL